MKKLLKFLFYNQYFAKFLLKNILNIHSKTYALSSRLSILLNSGIHPKHHIMGYKEWFLNHINHEWVVLDVGCNTGMMPEVMSIKADYVYGIELDCSYIEIAKCERQKKNVEYICADATTFNYSPLKAIDCVTLSNVLEHIENRSEFLEKLILHVKWKGSRRFLIRVPMIDREWITVYKKELGLEYRLDPTHYTEYTFEQFEMELREVNISIISHHIRWGEIYAVCEAKV